SLCTKYTLFFINVIFFILGLLVMTVGVYMVKELKKDLKGVQDWLKLESTFHWPVVIFFVIGILMFFIGFFGCVGALRENTCFLTVYGTSVFLCLILLIACGAVAYTQKDKVQALKERLKQDLKKYLDDPLNQDLIDFMQTLLKCCGVESYKDWQANPYFNCSSPGRMSCGVPFSCCKESIQFNRQCGYDAGKLKTDAERLENGVYSGGCWPSIKGNLYTVIGITGAVLICIIFTMCMAFSFRAQIREVKKYARFQS
ncbi:predicted protein, partial [Nematostella vectensis]